MKELGVIAVLMALGYGAESSLVFVLGESCRVYEDLPKVIEFKQFIVEASAVPKTPLQTDSNGLLEKSNTPRVALLIPEVH